MPIWLIILLAVLAVVVVALIVLTIVGMKLQKKQEANQEQIDAAKQTVSMLIIDKKNMKLKDAGLPKIVLDQTPKYLRGTKVPVVKAKIGPRVMNMMCDEKVFDYVPTGKEVKAQINGIYIIGVKALRGQLDSKPEKKGFWARMRAKAEKTLEENNKEKAAAKAKKKK
jgi:hypothetical protein